jgi:hypothetical protein
LDDDKAASNTKKGDWTFPAVFSVSGRTAYQMFVEFKVPSLGFELKARDYPVAIEAKLGHKGDWHKILQVTLHIGRIIEPDHYITYENTTGDLYEKERENMQIGLDMAQLGTSKTDGGSVDLPTINEPGRDI